MFIHHPELGKVHIQLKSYFIPPKKVHIFENMKKEVKYKYCVLDHTGKEVSFPLPVTKEVLDLVERGVL